MLYFLDMLVLILRALVDINIFVTPVDRNGIKIGVGLPPNTISVNIESNFGNLSSTTEILDAYGSSTGEFMATLTNDSASSINISAKIGTRYISDFIGNNFQKRIVTVQFISKQNIITRDSSEPLGTIHSE